jgi:hypothetical protein
MLLPVLMFSQMLISQNPNIDYKYGIKLYNLTRYEETEKPGFLNATTHNYSFDKKNNLQLFHPTVALQWKTKKNNFHEIEVVDLRSEQQKSVSEIRNDSLHGIMTVSASTLTETTIALRYEYTFVFNKKKDKKFVPSLGIAGSPYFKSYKSIPELSSSFSVAEKHIGLRMFVTPRVTYYFSKRIFFDVNIPICISQTEYNKQSSDDPAIPSAQRTTSSFDANLAPKLFSVRFGIGIKL